MILQNIKAYLYHSVAVNYIKNIVKMIYLWYNWLFKATGVLKIDGSRLLESQECRGSSVRNDSEASVNYSCLLLFDYKYLQTK